MNSYRVAIVEDEKEAADRLLSCLTRFGREEGFSFSVSSFSSSVEFIETYKAQYDLLLLDIAMPQMSGMELAREIRKTDEKTALVFVTSLAQFAVESYDVGASNYILKPLSYPEFRMKVLKVFLSLPEKEKDSLTLRNKSGSYKIDLGDLYYVETSGGHSLLFHTAQGVVTERGTMKDAEKKLPGEDFLRINSCYLVNLSHLDALEGREAKLSDGTRLWVSRPRYAEVLRRFEKRAEKKEP